MRATASPSGGAGNGAKGAVVGTTGSSVDGAVVAVGDVVVVVDASRCGLLELLLEVVLRLGRVDPGAPELVGDEQEEQQPDRHQGPPDGARAPCAWARRLTPTLRGLASPVRPLSSHRP